MRKRARLAGVAEERMDVLLKLGRHLEPIVLATRRRPHETLDGGEHDFIEERITDASRRPGVERCIEVFFKARPE